MSKKNKARNAISLLTRDHDDVKELFDEFEETKNATRRARIVQEALAALKLHSAVEEELFYPAVRHTIPDKNGIMDQADEEHHVAKILIAELQAMSGEEEHWAAKFMVLADVTRRHIKEEEGTMFKKARKSEIDLDVLGSQMSDLKQKLLAEGAPPDFETAMIAKCGLRGASPSRNAVARVQAPLKQTAA